MPSSTGLNSFCFIFWKSTLFIRTRMNAGQQASLLVISADLEIITRALYLQRDDIEQCKSWKVKLTFHLDVLFIQMYLKEHSYESTTVAKLYLILAIIGILLIPIYSCFNIHIFIFHCFIFLLKTFRVDLVTYSFNLIVANESNCILCNVVERMSTYFFKRTCLTFPVVIVKRKTWRKCFQTAVSNKSP